MAVGQNHLKNCAAVFEMYPITLAFIMFREELKGKSILIHTNNEALVHVINNKTSKDTLIISLFHKIILIGLEFNIRVRAEHIPGHINIQADSLSRLQISKFKEAAPESDAYPVTVPQQYLPQSLLKS